MHPVIIGSFFVRAQDKLLLDLRSIERAVAAIVFFDKHLPRKVTRVFEAEVVNRLFAPEDARLTPDSIFDRANSAWVDPQAAMQRMKELVAYIEDPQERLRVALEDMHSHAKQPLPEIERFPIHYYEEGIDSFVAVLRMRQIVALQHSLGNTGYSLYDVLWAMANPK